MNYEIRQNSQTLHDLRVGESMHSDIGAWEEANLVYVGQAELARRAKIASSDSAVPPLTIHDLGLGVGANALATVAAYRELPSPKRRLRIESFEWDLSAIALALDSAESFPYLREFSAVLRELLHARRWRSPTEDIEWNLHEGDFLKQELSSLAPAEVIYFDFFSPRAAPKLWTADLFAKLRARSPDACLITYSAATRVRAALLQAGWVVGEGVATPLKRQTTIARSGEAPELARPLDLRWLERWRRSGAKMPEGCALDEKGLASVLAAAPQFSVD